jgi:hypothetical protein
LRGVAAFDVVGADADAAGKAAGWPNAVDDP